MTCSHYRLTHSPRAPRYNGSHQVTHYACFGPASCPHRDSSLEGCIVKGKKPKEAMEVAAR